MSLFFGRVLINVSNTDQTNSAPNNPVIITTIYDKTEENNKLG